MRPLKAIRRTLMIVLGLFLIIPVPSPAGLYQPHATTLLVMLIVIDTILRIDHHPTETAPNPSSTNAQ